MSIPIYAFDALSQLAYSEVSIAAATTLTSTAFGKMHVCTGSSYTVDLPAVSGNTGKIIGIRMAPALTGFVTLDANSTETIDGATTRKMWAQESAILLCNGTEWVKIGGKTRALQAIIRRNSNQTGIATGLVSATTIALDTSVKDNSALMVETANNRLRIQRAGSYDIKANISLSIAAAATRCISNLLLSAAQIGRFEASNCSTTTTPSLPLYLENIDFAVNDLLTLGVFHNSGVNATALGDSTINYTFLSATENPTW